MSSRYPDINIYGAGADAIFYKVVDKDKLKFKASARKVHRTYKHMNFNQLASKITTCVLHKAIQDVMKGYVFVMPSIQSCTISLNEMPKDITAKIMDKSWADDYDLLRTGFKLYLPILSLRNKDGSFKEYAVNVDLGTFKEYAKERSVNKAFETGYKKVSDYWDYVFKEFDLIEEKTIKQIVLDGLRRIVYLLNKNVAISTSYSTKDVKRKVMIDFPHYLSNSVNKAKKSAFKVSLIKKEVDNNRWTSLTNTQIENMNKGEKIWATVYTAKRSVSCQHKPYRIKYNGKNDDTLKNIFYRRPLQLTLQDIEI